MAKASEFRNMTVDELKQKELDLRKELFNLRFQQEVGQLESSAKMKQVKHDIARVQTILRESSLTEDLNKNKTEEE